MLLVGVVAIGADVLSGAPNVEPMEQVPSAPAAEWPSVSAGGVDYRLWPLEDAPLDELTLTMSDFDAECAWVLGFRLPSGERGGWSVCPDPVPPDTVQALPHQMRGTRGGAAGVVVILSSDRDVREVDVALTDGSTHTVALVDLAALDPDRPVHVGLLPKPFGVEVEAVGDLGWNGLG